MVNPSSQRNLKLIHHPIIMVLDAHETEDVGAWSDEGDALEASLLYFKVKEVFLMVWECFG